MYSLYSVFSVPADESPPPPPLPQRREVDTRLEEISVPPDAPEISKENCKHVLKKIPEIMEPGDASVLVKFEEFRIKHNGTIETPTTAQINDDEEDENYWYHVIVDTYQPADGLLLRSTDIDELILATAFVYSVLKRHFSVSRIVYFHENCILSVVYTCIKMWDGNEINNNRVITSMQLFNNQLQRQSSPRYDFELHFKEFDTRVSEIVNNGVWERSNKDVLSVVGYLPP